MRKRRQYRFWKGLALGGGLTIAAALLYVQSIKAEDGLYTPFYTIPGHSSYVEGAIKTKPLGLRHLSTCRWGNPGSNTYKGTTEQALMALGIDPITRKALAYRIEHKAFNDTARVDNAGIVALGSRQRFHKTMSMTFGKSLCTSTTPNFKLGHSELGELYSEGGVYVLIPRVCGNISLITPINRLAVARAITQPQQVHTVPEPGSLWLFGLGALVMIIRHNYNAVLQANNPTTT